jgi:glycosyltransferase involved in cell wall biosynthesis
MFTNNSNLIRPRLCILNGSFYPKVGGGEIHAKLLAENLIEQNIDLFVLTRKYKKDLKSYEILGRIPVFRVLPTGFVRWGKYLWLIPASVKLFKMRKRYDIIYVSGLRLAGLFGVIMSMFLKKKCILRSESCGELSGEFIWDSISFKRKSIFALLIKICIFLRNTILKRANCFVSISSTIRAEYLRCNVDPKKIVQISNGIDTNKFQPIFESKKENIRKKLGLPYQNIFIYTGKLNKGKGLELLLRTWEKVIHNNMNAHLVLAGSGQHQFLSCEQDLKSYVYKNRLKRCVTFTGYIENVHEYLQASDYFVFPSESEALPISLLEALSCGLPSIATKAGGIVDIIRSGFNGKLIEINNGKELYESIIEFLESPGRAKKMGKAGREYILKHFSIKKIAKQHEDLLHTIILK